MDQATPYLWTFCAVMAGLGLLRQAAAAAVIALVCLALLIWLSGAGAPDLADDHLAGIGTGLVLLAGLVTPVVSLLFYGLGAALRRALTGKSDDD